MKTNKEKTVENMVNEHAHQEAIRKEQEKREARRQKKKLDIAVSYALASVGFMIMDFFAWMVWWLAVPLGLVCAFAGMFHFGRWYENGKWLGWRY